MGTFHPLVAQSTVQCPHTSQLSTIMYRVAVALLLVGLSMTNAAFMGAYGGLGYGAGVGAMGVGAIAAPVAVGGVGHTTTTVHKQHHVPVVTPVVTPVVQKVVTPVVTPVVRSVVTPMVTKQ